MTSVWEAIEKKVKGLEFIGETIRKRLVMMCHSASLREYGGWIMFKPLLKKSSFSIRIIVDLWNRHQKMHSDECDELMMCLAFDERVNNQIKSAQKLIWELDELETQESDILKQILSSLD